MSETSTSTPSTSPGGPPSTRAMAAEALGTFWLVLGGCGTVIFNQSDGGAGILAIALAFGLTVLTGAYAFGHISGAHFNPAVTLGLAAAGRFPWRHVPGYVLAQISGGLLAGATLFTLAHGLERFSSAGHMATNGYGAHSPAGYAWWAVALAEILFTALFVIVILGATAQGAVDSAAGMAIGLCLTLIHLVTIPIDGTSVNPARSLGVAPFGGADALAQVWLFLLAPAVGALVAAALYRSVFASARPGTVPSPSSDAHPAAG